MSSAALRKVVQLNGMGKVWTLNGYVQSGLTAVCNALAAAGITVDASRDTKFFDETQNSNIYQGLCFDGQALAQAIPQGSAPWFAGQLNYSSAPSTVMQQSSVHRLWLQEVMSNLIFTHDVDLIITGTTALAPPTIAAHGAGDPSSMGYIAFTSILSICGYPAVSIPCGIDPVTGTGFGIQLVARHWRDYDLIRWAKQIESICGPSILPGYVPVSP